MKTKKYTKVNEIFHIGDAFSDFHLHYFLLAFLCSSQGTDAYTDIDHSIHTETDKQ